jgi:Ca-activated chloride channel homolog
VPRDILILGLAMAVQTLAAQVPAVEAAEQPFKLSVTAELVLLDVSVKSSTGEHVSGLSKDNFKVYEDGKLQAVSHFASEDLPVSAGLVVDTSGSTRTKRPEVVTAALACIDASNRNVEIFVVRFSDGVALAFPPILHLPAT